MTAASPPELAEISDLIVDYDVRSLARRAVHRDDVLARLALSGQEAARAMSLRSRTTMACCPRQRATGG